MKDGPIRWGDGFPRMSWVGLGRVGLGNWKGNVVPYGSSGGSWEVSLVPSGFILTLQVLLDPSLAVE